MGSKAPDAPKVPPGVPPSHPPPNTFGAPLYEPFSCVCHRKKFGFLTQVVCGPLRGSQSAFPFLDSYFPVPFFLGSSLKKKLPPTMWSNTLKRGLWVGVPGIGHRIPEKCPRSRAQSAGLGTRAPARPWGTGPFPDTHRRFRPGRPVGSKHLLDQPTCAHLPLSSPALHHPLSTQP